MNLPAFTAQASLYRTRNRYCGEALGTDTPPPRQHIVPAYMPGPATMRDCGVCTGLCDKEMAGCAIVVAAGVSAVCIGTLGFGCPAAVSAGEAILVACAEAYAACIGYCNIPGWVPVVGGYCCPKICGTPNPLEGSGSGCCDLGEACVDQHDPNARQGCCPSGQAVCSGHCCASGERCCGDGCCPSHFHCLDGGICAEFPPFAAPGASPPTPPENHCLFGGAPCGTKCCPPGLACCGVFNGQPDCKTSCLH